MQNEINKETKIKVLPEYLFSPEFIDEIYHSHVFYRDSDDVYPATNKYANDNWFIIIVNIVFNIMLTHNTSLGSVEKIDFHTVYTNIISQVKLVVLYPLETESVTSSSDLILELENIHLPKNFFSEKDMQELRNKYYINMCRLNGLLALYIIKETEHL